MSVANGIGTSPVQETRKNELRIICVLGRSGAGKDSKVEKAMKLLGDRYEVLVMSNLLVEAQKKDPEFKAYAEKLMAQGDLLPDEDVMRVLFEALAKYEGTDKIILLNGFPRTELQAVELMKRQTSNHYKVETALLVELDEEIIIERLADRRVCPNRCPSSPYTVSDYHPPKVPGICDDCGAELVQRADDKPETIRKRIREYDANEGLIVSALTGTGEVSLLKVNNADGKACQARFNAILAEIAGN